MLPGLPGNAPPVHTKALSKLGDGRWLDEFAIPMTIDAPVIPRDSGYNLRVDVRMDNPACTRGVDEAVMPNVVRIHSDPDHRPRMEFAVTNPIRIEALHPQFLLGLAGALRRQQGPSQPGIGVGYSHRTVNVQGRGHKG